MGIAFPWKWLFALGYCLWFGSELSAQFPVEQPPTLPNNPPPQVRSANPNGPTPPLTDLPPYPYPVNLKPITIDYVKENEEQRKSMESAWRWFGLIAGAIIAVLGGWGAGATMRKEEPPANTAPPKMQTEELGLGTDGKGGVWKREVPPWEK
jgi:hypothetical protein